MLDSFLLFIFGPELILKLNLKTICSFQIVSNGIAQESYALPW